MYKPSATILIHIDDLMELGLWEAYCDESKTSPYAIKEGSLDRGESISMSWRTAQRIHLIEKLQNTIN
jgi:hypothetical protein